MELQDKGMKDDTADNCSILNKTIIEMNRKFEFQGREIKENRDNLSSILNKLNALEVKVDCLDRAINIDRVDSIKLNNRPTNQKSAPDSRGNSNACFENDSKGEAKLHAMQSSSHIRGKLSIHIFTHTATTTLCLVISKTVIVVFLFFQFVKGQTMNRPPRCVVVRSLWID